MLISPDFLHVFPETRVSDIQGITASCFSVGSVSAVCHPLIDIVLTVVQLGNLLGCLLAAIFGGRLGRKMTMWIGAAISATGGILQVAAFSFPQLIVGRVINGVGNGRSWTPCFLTHLVMLTLASNRYGHLHLRHLPG
jgi:MFS family permease